MTRRINRKYKVCVQSNLPIWDHSERKNIKALKKGPQKRRQDKSTYGVRLRDKQNLKMYYGNINEKQFSNLYQRASLMEGKSGENFLWVLESRLDAALYRSNFASTIFSSRQMISHGHIIVNGETVKSPSFSLKEGDVVKVHPSSIKHVANSILKHCYLDGIYLKPIPLYLEVDVKSLSFVLIYKPMPFEITYNQDFDVKSVVEYYS